MEINKIEYYDIKDFIQTPTGVKVSRSALMCLPEQVEMPGGKSIIMHKAIIRADFAHITIHKFCFIGEETILRPPFNPNHNSKPPVFIPMHIGSYTIIGNNSVIESAYIGIGCKIGNNCVLSPRSILKDFVTVEDNTVVPPDLVLPPFSIISGNPGKIIGENPESVATTTQIFAKSKFHFFQPIEQSS